MKSKAVKDDDDASSGSGEDLEEVLIPKKKKRATTLPVTPKVKAPLTKSASTGRKKKNTETEGISLKLIFTSIDDQDNFVFDNVDDVVAKKKSTKSKAKLKSDEDLELVSNKKVILLFHILSFIRRKQLQLYLP